jgi:hypothetical protein
MKIIFFNRARGSSYELGISYSNGIHGQHCIIVRVFKWAWRIEFKAYNDKRN